MRVVLMVIGVLLVMFQAAHGKIYRWIDCDGRLHFTDRVHGIPAMIWKVMSIRYSIRAPATKA